MKHFKLLFVVLLCTSCQFFETEKISSETFYESYSTGKEPENDAWVLDFEKWAGLYEVWCDRQTKAG